MSGEVGFTLLKRKERAPLFRISLTLFYHTHGVMSSGIRSRGVGADRGRTQLAPTVSVILSLLCHPERSNKAESKDLDRGKNAEGAVCIRQTFLRKNVTSRHWTATLLLRSRNGFTLRFACSPNGSTANFDSTSFRSG